MKLIETTLNSPLMIYKFSIINISLIKTYYSHTKIGDICIEFNIKSDTKIISISDDSENNVNICICLCTKHL